MDKHGFFTTLFMSVTGIIFIIGAIGLIYLGIKVVVDNINIRNNGIEVNAKIIDKYISYSTSNGKRHIDYINYKVEYTLNESRQTYRFSSKSNSYNEGETIDIYCLEDNPKKVFCPLEASNIAMQVPVCIAGAVALLVIGWLSIKNYNIFKYKRVINVE